MSSTYGTLFKITTFGESHGKSLGVIIDGCPAGLPIDEAFIQQEMDRRAAFRRGHTEFLQGAGLGRRRESQVGSIALTTRSRYAQGRRRTVHWVCQRALVPLPV